MADTDMSSHLEKSMHISLKWLYSDDTISVKKPTHSSCASLKVNKRGTSTLLLPCTGVEDNILYNKLTERVSFQICKDG